MDDEERRSIKMHKRYWDRVDAVQEAQQGIPTHCPCGKACVKKVDEEDPNDSKPGKSYVICSDYEKDGLHFRQPWVDGVEQEFEMLTRLVAENEQVIRGCLLELDKLKLRVSELESAQ